MAVPKPQESDADKEARLVFSYGSQFKALVLKSATYQKRQVKTNICQLVFPVFFILILFLLQTLITSFIVDEFGSVLDAVDNPTLQIKRTLFPDDTSTEECVFTPGTVLNFERSNILITSGSIDLGTAPVFANNSNSLAVADYGTGALQYLHGTINPQNIESSLPLGNSARLQSFSGRTVTCDAITNTMVVNVEDSVSKEEIDEILFDSWRSKTYIAGLVFSDFDATGFNVEFTVMYNASLTFGSDVPLFTNMVSRMAWGEIAQKTGDYVWAGYKGYPLPERPLEVDIISQIGPTLYIYVFSLLFPVFVTSLAFEKENKLREIMKMMGLTTSVYWVVTYLFFLVLYIVASALVFILAVAFDFQYFVANSPSLLIVFLFLWGNVQIGFSLFLSVFLTKARTATVIGYIILVLTGILAGQLIDPILASENPSRGAVFGISLIPQFALYRGLKAFGSALFQNGPGMTWENMGDYELDDVMIFMVVEWIVFMVLGIYFELVLPIGPGLKKHPLFFLPKSCRAKEYVPSSGMDATQDVADERKAAGTDTDAAIRVLEIGKVYPGGCGSPDFTAVKNLSMRIQSGTCFGFLGPNGAGKSTTINMLSGYLRPSGGSAIIGGNDITEDLDAIRLKLGVCPQDNVLWDDLTGPEHLRFFGRLKNLWGKALEAEVDYWLDQVNLSFCRERKSMNFSGGMKRRLSVAISMIGSPSVVLLDEPTTGLDPASKHALWDVVLNYKPEAALMLTTHSMEEAEALCDRLGIFVAGQLVAVGPSEDLKARYGSGYRLVVTTPLEAEKAATSFIMSLLPNAVQLNSLGGTQNFTVPKAGIKLSYLFEEIEKKKKKLQIVDWGISDTSLEEVFLKITDTLADGKTLDMVDVKVISAKGHAAEEAALPSSSAASASASASSSSASASANARAAPPSDSDSSSSSGSGSVSQSASASQTASASASQSASASVSASVSASASASEGSSSENASGSNSGGLSMSSVSSGTSYSSTGSSESASVSDNIQDSF